MPRPSPRTNRTRRVPHRLLSVPDAQEAGATGDEPGPGLPPHTVPVGYYGGALIRRDSHVVWPLERGLRRSPKVTARSGPRCRAAPGCSLGSLAVFLERIGAVEQVSSSSSCKQRASQGQMSGRMGQVRVRGRQREGEPATVVTTPRGHTFRILWLPKSATRRCPVESSARPCGRLRRAFVPVASTSPARPEPARRAG